MKPFVTDEVFSGLKQPFIAPPTTRLNEDAMYILLQDILRSNTFRSVPFFDRDAVIKLLDDLPAMERSKRNSMDPILFMMASIAVLQERYGLSA